MSNHINFCWWIIFNDGGNTCWRDRFNTATIPHTTNDSMCLLLPDNTQITLHEQVLVPHIDDRCNLNKDSMLRSTFNICCLTYWGRVTHICVSKLTVIGSDNDLSPDRRQAIIWTKAGILLIGPLRTDLSEIFIEILTFSFKKMRMKVSSAKRWPFCLSLSVLNINGTIHLSTYWVLCQLISKVRLKRNMHRKEIVIPMLDIAVCTMGIFCLGSIC